MTQKNYFGTDGIRFIYQEDTKELISKIGKALNSSKCHKVIIGHDTRYSSKEITSLITNQLNKEVFYVGNIATPGICFLSQKHKCLGVMITASHNPAKYNGIKIFYKGLKLNKSQQIKLSKLMDTFEISEISKKDFELDLSLKNDYIAFLKNFIRPSKYKCIFDASNGAVSDYIIDVIKKINPLNKVINNNPDGHNINLKCGATDVKSLQEALIKEKYDYGFAFDGDADRLILVTKDQVFNGNSLVYILANYYQEKHVVLTKLTSLGEINSFEKKNIKVHIVDVGDSNILNLCQKKHYSLGGEDSGHILQLQQFITGDGLLNAISILNIMQSYSLDRLLFDYYISPSELINLSIKNIDTLNHPFLLNLIETLKQQFINQSYILLRKSGTENKVRLYISTLNQTALNYIKNKIVTCIKLIDNNIDFINFESISIDEKTTFDDNVTLRGQITLINSQIHSNSIINNSTIIDSIIGQSCSIGPYSHIRNQSIIDNGVRIGNFVEVKKSHLGDKTKVSHLSYIGDCECGKYVNVGCGSITVNYDGKNKYKTIIGNKVFIGCNSNLIAPITIEDETFIAAGSTITTSLKKHDFAIARAKQVTKENRAKQYPFLKEE